MRFCYPGVAACIRWLGLGLVLAANVAQAQYVVPAPKDDPVFDAARGRRNSDQGTNSWSRQVRHGAEFTPLPAGTPTDVQLDIDGQKFDLDGFMARNRVVGALVISRGKVVAERYRLGNRPDTYWPMSSVTKSVTATLAGAAIQDGAIRSIDDQVQIYLPELAKSAYDGVTIRHLMQMSSGVDIHDDYFDQNSAFQKLVRTYFDPTPGASLKFLATLPRKHAPGTTFSYAGSDTYVLGQLVARAVKKPLATYLSEKIWVPAGMQYDAGWLLDAGGQEQAAGGLRATLQDVGRVAQLVLDGGRIGDRRVVPEGWFGRIAEVEPRLAPGQLKDYAPLGYSYHWWALPSGGASYQIGDDGGFAALGVFGQQVYLIPKAQLAVVLQSAWEKPVELKRSEEGAALAAAFVQKLK